MPLLRSSVLGVVLAALAGPAGAQTPLQFRPDAATFRYGPGQSMVEVYLSFRAHSLPFVPAASGGFAARVPTRVRLLPVSQSAPAGTERTAAYDETLAFEYIVADTTGLMPEQVFVEQMRLVAPPGEYELEVVLAPEGQSTTGAVLDVSLPAYAQGGGTTISGIELATSIGKAAEGDAHVKSGLAIRPNPDAYFGGADVPVRYYAEIYAPPGAGSDYTLLTFLAETATGTPMAELQRRTRRPLREVDVVVGSLDIRTVPSGIYYLRLVVLDDANQSVAEQSKRLFIINPDVEVEALATGAMSYEETVFAAMGEEELALNLRHAAVISSQRERQQIADLVTDDQRRGYLTSFWTSRDDDGLPNVNSARRQFYERLATVNDRFREPGRQGFETDRGRVFLTYGPPAELDRQPYDPKFVQHEIWNYDNIPGQGRSIFIFADRYNSSQMELIHSNVNGEVSVPDWQQEILR